jgi:hypothetical protein
MIQMCTNCFCIDQEFWLLLDNISSDDSFPKDSNILEPDKFISEDKGIDRYNEEVDDNNNSTSNSEDQNIPVPDKSMYNNSVKPAPSHCLVHVVHKRGHFCCLNNRESC